MALRLLFIWMIALLPAAQDADLTLSARAGFDGLFEESAAIPVIVTARNDGAPIDGEIRVAVSDNLGGDTLIYSAPISLPTGSDKRIALVVHAPSFSGELTIQLVEDEGVIAETQTNQLNRVGREELLYGVISSDPGGLAFLETKPGDRADAVVAFLDLADLPDVSSAWNALDVLVLDDVDTSRLTAGQSASLRAWVEGGGLLVVTGGPGGPQTAAGVADLLPVGVTGVESVDDLPALSEYAGVPFNAPGPYLVTASDLTGGEMLIQEDELPVLAYDDLGRGGVYFLALDPKLAPLAGWEGQDQLWGEIAASAPTAAPWGMGIQNGYAANQAISFIPGLRLPSVLQLVFFLFLYTLIIGPINFLVLRRLKRPELAWVTVPALVLLFSAATFLTGFRARGNTATLNQMSVTYGSVNAERVWTQTILGLYSPRRALHDIALPYDSSAFPLAESFGLVLGPGNLDAIARANDLTLRGVRTDTSEVAPFIVEAHLPRPPIAAEAALSPEGDAVEVVVRNSANETLEDAVFVYGQEQLALGDIPPGEERSARLPLTPGVSTAPNPTPNPLFSPGFVILNPLTQDPSLILGTGDFFSDPVAFPRWQILQALDSGSTSLPAESVEPTEKVTLAGWLEGSVQEATVAGGEVTQTGVTLLLLEVPVQ
jgi:hypothetical protein